MKKLKNLRKKKPGQIDYASDECVSRAKAITPGQTNESKGDNAREYDYEGEMTKQQLRTIEMAAKELQGMISDNQNLPEWWQNKITLATDYMQTARDYLKSDVKESLDERTPVRPTVQDKKLKNLRVPNPNFKGTLKRKKPNERSMDKFREHVTKEGNGLWANIHAKRKRGEKMRKKGEKGAPTPAAIKNAQKEDVTEKITIGKIRKAAYKTGKALGDVNAVKRGKVGRRIKNRVIGKLVGKAMGALMK